MGSVCGKHARKRGKYEVTSGGGTLPGVKPDSTCSACRRNKQCSSEHTHPDAGQIQSTEQRIKACPASAVPQKQKPDPKDFMFMNLKNETQLKLPASVNGQQFIIDTCEDCDLYVMDTCAMVTVDDCKDCRIFIGPTESSVFLRNCTNCKLACITHQLRTRDCQSCDILLHTRTRPIIESSSAISIGCYSTPYAGLAQQLAAAKLSPFHNFWSDVYDFTPAAVTAESQRQQQQQQQQNWKLLPVGTSIVDLMGRVPDRVQMLLQQQQTAMTLSAAPVLAGVNACAGSHNTVAAGEEVKLCEFLRSTASTPAVDSIMVMMINQSDMSAAGRTVGCPEAPDAATAAAAAVAGSGSCRSDGAQHQLTADDIGLMIVAGSSPTCQAGKDSAAHNGHSVGNSTSSSTAAEVQQPVPIHAVEAADAGPGVTPSEKDVQSVIVTAGQLVDVQKLPEDCYAFVLFLPGQQDAALHWVAQQFPCTTAAAAGGEASNTTAVLVRTNEAIIPVEVLKQMKKAQYSQGEFKQLSAAAQQQQLFIGLEVQCSDVEQQQHLCTAAKSAGAVCCKSLQAAKLFRFLGTDG